MFPLPNRASDAGPNSSKGCQSCGAPATGKGSWSSKGDCQLCGDPCCSKCAVSISVDKAGNPDPEGKRTVLVDAKCTEAVSDLLMAEGFVVEVLN